MLFWCVPSAHSSEPAWFPVWSPMGSICRWTTRLLGWRGSEGTLAIGGAPPRPVRARRMPRRLLRLVAAAELVAGREALASAAHAHHAHGGVGVGGLQRADDPAAQRVVERVALLGAVQRDAPHLGCGV